MSPGGPGGPGRPGGPWDSALTVATKYTQQYSQSDSTAVPDSTVNSLVLTYMDLLNRKLSQHYKC